jgi:hypothetical protein
VIARKPSEITGRPSGYGWPDLGSAFCSGWRQYSQRAGRPGRVPLPLAAITAEVLEATESSEQRTTTAGQWPRESK